MNIETGFRVVVLYSDGEDSEFDGLATCQEAAELAAERMMAGPTATDALVIGQSGRVWEHHKRR